MTSRPNPIIDGYFISSLAATLAAIGCALGLFLSLSFVFYWIPWAIAAVVCLFFAWYYRLFETIFHVAARPQAAPGKTGDERP